MREPHEIIINGETLDVLLANHSIEKPANLDRADLSGANLTSTKLSGVNMSETNLDNANLTDAILDNANLMRAKLKGANLYDALDQIYPWIQQIGADKSGMYSYTWLENLVGCKIAKDEVIRPEWQNLKEGDLMKMCAGDFAPPPYIVAQVIPNQAVIFGHQEKGEWVELWAFVLVPQADGTTRLITRTQTNMVGGFWEVIRPIGFVMEQKMLTTIKELSSKTQ